MNANCLICGEEVPLYAQSDHLRFKHPGPFKFWFDAKEYSSDKPSLLVMDVLKIAGSPPLYQFFEEREDGDVPFSHMNSVDLTREPRFYSVPPATF